MKEIIELNIRPLLQKFNIVGNRGPASSYVLPGILAGFSIVVLLLIAFINVYEFAFTGSCPLCGKKHVRTV
jgi:hypothetical protein